MSMTKREKTVVRNAAAKLATTKMALTDRMVRSGLKIILREADLVDEVPIDEVVEETVDG